MERISVNLKTSPVFSEENINVEYISAVTEGNLLVKTTKRHGLISGDYVSFKKYKQTDSDTTEKSVISENSVQVLSADAYNFIIEPSEANKYYLSTSYEKGDSVIVTFNEKHNLCPQDFKENDTLLIYNERNGIISAYTGVRACGIDNLEAIDPQDSGYTAWERSSVIIPSSGFNKSTLTSLSGVPYTFILSASPYYTISSGLVTLKDNTALTKRTGVINVGLPINVESDFSRLGSEDLVNDVYTNNIKNKTIPDFINLEKVKYEPYIEDFGFANELEINLRFRDRGDCYQYDSGITVTSDVKKRAVYSEEVPVAGVTSASPRYIYTITSDGVKTYYEANYVGWVTDQTKYWNICPQGREYDYDSLCGESDLLGLLGFNDEDVLNQKNVLKKSFLRILYYDSSDPSNQSLLGYNTIFLDSGELFGKLTKMKNKVTDYYNNETKSPDWVYYDGSSSSYSGRLDSRITIYNEYNTEKSSEGFYLYMFEDDAPNVPETYEEYSGEKLPTTGITDGKAYRLMVNPILISAIDSYTGEVVFADVNDYIIARKSTDSHYVWEVKKEAQTIYMKVEFNHAKYGRTIPMMLWPVVGTKFIYTAVTLTDFIEKLYIKVSIRKDAATGRYLYEFPDVKGITTGDGKISLTLFEAGVFNQG